MPAPKTPKFEAALESLETIVADMENGDLPLDELIARYEEGIRLVKVCQEKLAEAEQKIDVVTQEAAKPSL
ncbi:MAG: exodeoxyribonuclease VII small subunit [Verrucomicrobium sp.]|nr:exodeoxyribonuclease VII small subunit [Verrucomicrobium sp.]